MNAEITRAEEVTLFDPFETERNAMKTILPRPPYRRKPSRHGFETLSDIIRRLEDHITPDRFDVPLSLQLDGAHLLREQQALGIWRFDYKRRVLAYFNERGHWQYEIDLDRCTTSAQVLDWIFQIVQKSWATDRVLSALLHALNAILHPQSTLCGCGHEHGPIDIGAVLQQEACQ
jgi:hypothetical protein